MIPTLSRSILRVPAAFYSLAALIAFAPCWLRGRAYFDNDLLAQFGPWRQFLKDQLAQGNFPLWNPYLMGGTPFFADPQNMMLYPFNWPTLLLPLAAGLTFFFMIHMAWAGWGMHRWLSALGLSEGSCRVGGLLFCFSGFFWMEIIHPPVLAAFSWLPWLFYTLEGLSQGPSPRKAFWAGLVFSQFFLAGSFQVFLGGLYGGVAYFAFRAWPLHKKKGLLPAALLFLWGALPLVGQLIPTFEFSALCTRRVEGLDLKETREKLSLDWGSLHRSVLPRTSLGQDEDLIGPLQSLRKAQNLWIMLGYLGVWAPFLAALAFFRGDRSLPFLLLGILLAGYALCLGSNFPLHGLLTSLPGFSLIRVPFRYLFLPVLGLCVLAALGYEAWSSGKTGSRQGPFLKWALAYAFLIYLAALWRPSQNWRELLALGAGFLGLLIHGTWKAHAKKGAALFAAALTLPLLLSGWACFKPEPSSNFDFVKKSAMLQELGRELAPRRGMFLGEVYYPIQAGGKKYAVHYPENAACALGLRNFGGYNPLELTAKRELALLPLGTLVKLGAVAALVSQQDLSLPGFKKRLVPPYKVHEWQGEMPTVFAPLEQEVHPDRWKRLERMAEKGFDPHRTAVFAGPLPEEIRSLCKLQSPPPARMTYNLEMDGAERQVFALTLDKHSLVVFCETMFPGWKAQVDGKPSLLLTADHFLRCLFLPPGEHRIEFKFRPFWWPAVPIALALWLSVTLVAFLLLRRKGGLLV